MEGELKKRLIPKTQPGTRAKALPPAANQRTAQRLQARLPTRGLYGTTTIPTPNAPLLKLGFAIPRERLQSSSSQCSMRIA